MNASRTRLWTIVWLAAVSSAFGLVYSQLLVKVLAGLTSQFMIAQTVTLAFYIAAMGLGSWAGDFVREKNITKRLPQLQICSSVIGVTMVLFAYGIYVYLKFYFIEISDPREKEWLAQMGWLTVLLAQPAAFGAGFLSGLELNLLLRMGRSLSEEAGYSKVLAGSYTGTVAATLIFIWVIPSYTPLSTSLGLASANILFSLYLSWIFCGEDRARLVRHSAVALVMSMVISLLCMQMSWISQLYYRARELQGVQLQTLSDFVPFYREMLKKRPEIIRHSSAYQNGDFIFLPDGGFRFLLDFHPQVEQIWVADYHESFVHAPIQYSREIPRRTLILGGGDGGTAAELLKYGDAVEHIDVVELDPWMIHMAKTNPVFLDFNHGSFNDPKVTVHAQDAITYLRTTTQKYDAIYIDFPFPFETELVKLFSLEFYQLAARTLKPDGQMIADAPAGCAKNDPLEGNSGSWRTSIMNSLRKAGFKTTFPFCAINGFVMARLDEKPPAEGYHDYKISLQVMNEQYLNEIVTWKRGGVKRESGRVNSLFKPLGPLRARHF